MKYSVDWAPDAESELAEIWVNQPDERRNISMAQNQIDRLLTRDPLGYSSMLSEGLYAIVVQPLRIIFEVSNTEMSVRVVSAKWFP